MRNLAAFDVRHSGARVALTALVGVWLAGCSSDSTRLSESFNSNPFSNPFAAASNDASAPTPKVASAPLPVARPNADYAAAAHPSLVAVASLPPVEPATTGQVRAVPNRDSTVSAPSSTASAAGWSPVGGSPVVVAGTDTLETLSRRYGVPPSAMLKANGLTSASDIHGGMHIVVPVYSAAASAPAVDKPKHVIAETAPEPANHKARKLEEDAAADAAEPKQKAKAKALEDDKVAKAEAKPTKLVKDGAPAPVAPPNLQAKTVDPKTAPAKTAPAKTADAKTPAAKTADVKTADAKTADTKTTVVKKSPTTDPAPTASVHPAVTTAAQPITSAQADASGVAPEFRWPARGRIIESFKAGGNDGINIAVPEGTQVRAAESGVVAYAGSELKGYGNLVLIRHPNGFVSAYANNGELDVKRGDTVKRGQVIAKSGQSGNVSSPQLHFELRKGSTPVDPTSYLAGL